MISRRFLLFIVAGGLAALANFGSRIAFSIVMPYVPSIVLAYCVGMATAFVLNRLFVFTNATGSLHSQGAWFVLVNIAAVLQTIIVSLLMRDWALPAMNVTFHPEAIAHGVGVIVPVYVSYIGHKRLTFRSNQT